jgi:hypothetical protein
VADELGIISSSLEFVNKEEAGRNSIIKPPHIEKTVHTWPNFVSPGTSDMGLMSQSLGNLCHVKLHVVVVDTEESPVIIYIIESFKSNGIIRYRADIITEVMVVVTGGLNMSTSSFLASWISTGHDLHNLDDDP